MDRSERFTRALSRKLGDIEQTTRAAAAHYEFNDADSGRQISGSIDTEHLNL